MSKHTPQPWQKPEQIIPLPLEKINRHKRQAEEFEIAGRHKNVGQKDHKGAR